MGAWNWLWDPETSKVLYFILCTIGAFRFENFSPISGVVSHHSPQLMSSKFDLIVMCMSSGVRTLNLKALVPSLQHRDHQFLMSKVHPAL